jgi:hypothetical protein
MILTVVGLTLMLAGIVMIVIQAGRNWSWARGAAAKEAAGEKARISYAGAFMIAVGAIMVMIGTSGSPPAPPSP